MASFGGFDDAVAGDGAGLPRPQALADGMPPAPVGRGPGPLSSLAVEVTFPGSSNEADGYRELLVAYVTALGGTATTTVTEIADIPQEAVDSTLSSFDVNGREPSPLEKGKVVTWLRAVTQAAGPRPGAQGSAAGAADSSTAAESAVGPGPSAPGTGRKRMSEVLDQTNDSSFAPLAPEVVVEARLNFEKRTGGPPPLAERPTAVQLAALWAILIAGLVPFADFAIWGPFGHRAAKLRKFQAWVWIDSALQPRMLRGPSGYAAWRASWRVFRTAMVSLDAATPGALDFYQEGIRVLAETYPHAWGIIARADEAMRSEQWELLHEELWPTAPVRGIWSAILKASAYGEGSRRQHWWFSHVIAVATSPEMLATADHSVDVVEGIDSAGAEQPSKTRRAPGSRGGRRAAQSRPDTHAPPPASGPSALPPPPKPAGAGTQAEVCNNWNRGGCKDRCPHKRSHHCAVCGGPHRAKDVPACASRLPERPAAGPSGR